MTNFRTLLAEDDITLDSLVSTRFMEDDVDLIMSEITRHIKSLTALIVSEGNKLKSEKRKICVLRKKKPHLEGVREEIVKNMKFGRKRNNQMKVLPIMMGIDSDWINSQSFAKKCYYSWIMRKASLKKVHELDIQINTLDETLKKARIVFYHNLRGLINLKNDICKLHYFLMKIEGTASVFESTEVNNEIPEANTEINDGSNSNKYIGVGVNKLLSDCMRTLTATKEIAMKLQDTKKKMCVPSDMSVNMMSDEHQDNGITIEELYPEGKKDIESFHEETEEGMEKPIEKKEITLDELEKLFQEAHGIVDDIVEENEENDDYNQFIQNRDIENRHRAEIERNPNSMDIEIQIHKKSDRQFDYAKNQLHKKEVREEIGNEPLPKMKEERTGELTEARGEDAPGPSYANHARILKVPSLNQNKSDKEPVEARSDIEKFLDNLINKLINQGSGGLRTNSSDNKVILASEDSSLCSNQSNMSTNMDTRPWALKLASYSGSVGNPSDVTINENSPGPLKTKLSDDPAATLMNNQETILSGLCCEMSTLEPYLVVTEEKDESSELNNSFPDLDSIEVSRLYSATDSERYAR
mmetsp:Transcript_47520/g.92789  ORF Transcript_47520/g.92789 Transcript_47520/m.92789 type:complete len:584 (-) Transcript_47520:215-1966(-)